MSEPIRNIVVGIAAIKEQDPHLGPAIELAEVLGATLHVVHAFAIPDPIVHPYPETVHFDPSVIESLRKSAESQLEAQVRSISASEQIRCRVLPVPADLALLEAAAEVGADLLMVGATRLGMISRKVLGTTAQRVVRAAAMPVLVSRGAGRGRPRRVLLATDLSEIGGKVQRRAFEMLAMLSDPNRLEIRSLLVIDYDSSVLPDVSPSDLQREGELRLTDFLERTGAGDRGIEKAVQVGKPSREIVTQAEEWKADLLVLGTHGRRGVSRFLIGSVAESVLRSAPCDVLVIPTAAATSPEDIAG